MANVFKGNVFKGKSALVIDRVPEARATLRAQLSNIEVAEVKPCDNVTEAIRSMKAKTYNIILCEYDLEDMDTRWGKASGEKTVSRNGQQLLEEIRTTELLKYTQIFFMVTANTLYESVVSAAEYAPDDYIKKPFTPEMLYGRLYKCLEEKVEIMNVLIALDSGNLQKALAEADAYLKLPEKSMATRLKVERLRGKMLIQLGEFDRAAACYEGVLAVSVKPWAELGLGKALHFLGEFDRARELFEHVAKTSPDCVESLDFLAKSHEDAGEHPEAQTVITQAIKKNPARLDRHMRLGEIAIKNGDFETAETALKKATSGSASGSSFKSHEAHLLLAEVHMEKGNMADATKELEKVDAFFDTSPEARFGLALKKIDVLRKEGKPIDAFGSFAQAKGIFEANPEIVFPPKTLLRFAVECLIFKKKELGEKLLRELYKTTERKDLLLKSALALCPDSPTGLIVKIVFQEFEEKQGEMQDELSEVKMKALRNLLSAGNWEEAVVQSILAAEKLPQSVKMQTEVVLVLLRYMEVHGWNDETYYTAKEYLDRAEGLDAKNSRIGMIKSMLARVMGKYGLKNAPKDLTVFEKKQRQARRADEMANRKKYVPGAKGGSLERNSKSASGITTAKTGKTGSGREGFLSDPADDDLSEFML